MRKIIMLCMLLMHVTVHAQYNIKLNVQEQENNTNLIGATAVISSINRTSIADSTGNIIFNNLPAGNYSITVSHIGLEEKNLTIQLPQQNDSLITILLAEANEENEDDVVVTATRTSRNISDIPTRIETISGEELVEKANMKPGDIRMLLNESTGIQTQQTSATSSNSSIRIQGLDGKYTQILRDGFPLYAGFSGGLSLMQVAPLDLKQVEVIKGSSSTLYGGGAIAGLVNLVSKTPGEKKELNFIGNITSAKGFDASGFYSQRFQHIGVTVFGSANFNGAYDAAGSGLTAIPKFERYTINPKLFFYGKNTVANVGFSYITEDRLGGSLEFIKNGKAGYFEKNNTDRFTTQIDVQHTFSETFSLQFKNSYSNFHRTIKVPVYLFKGVQQSSYSFNFIPPFTTKPSSGA